MFKSIQLFRIDHHVNSVSPFSSVVRVYSHSPHGFIRQGLKLSQLQSIKRKIDLRENWKERKEMLVIELVILHWVSGLTDFLLSNKTNWTNTFLALSKCVHNVLTVKSNINMQYVCAAGKIYLMLGATCVSFEPTTWKLTTMHGTSYCLWVNEVWSTYLSHPLCMIPNV